MKASRKLTNGYFTKAIAENKRVLVCNSGGVKYI